MIQPNDPRPKSPDYPWRSSDDMESIHKGTTYLLGHLKSVTLSSNFIPWVHFSSIGWYEDHGSALNALLKQSGHKLAAVHRKPLVYNEEYYESWHHVVMGGAISLYSRYADLRFAYLRAKEISPRINDWSVFYNAIEAAVIVNEAIDFDREWIEFILRLRDDAKFQEHYRSIGDPDSLAERLHEEPFFASVDFVQSALVQEYGRARIMLREVPASTSNHGAGEPTTSTSSKTATQQDAVLEEDVEECGVPQGKSSCADASTSPIDSIQFIAHTAKRVREHIRKVAAEINRGGVNIYTEEGRRAYISRVQDEAIGPCMPDIHPWAVAAGVWTDVPSARSIHDVESILPRLLADLEERARIEAIHLRPNGDAVYYFIRLFEWSTDDAAEWPRRKNHHKPIPSKDEWDVRRWQLSKAAQLAATVRTASWGYDLRKLISYLEADISKVSDGAHRRDVIYRFAHMVDCLRLRWEVESVYPGLVFPPAPTISKGLPPRLVKEAITYYRTHVDNVKIAKSLLVYLDNAEKGQVVKSPAHRQASEKIVAPLWGEVVKAIRIAYVAGERYGIENVEELIKAMRFEDFGRTVSEDDPDYASRLRMERVQTVLTDVDNRADVELLKESLELVPPSTDHEGGTNHTGAAKETGAAEPQDDRISPADQVSLVFGTGPEDERHQRRLQLVGEVRKKALATDLISQPELRAGKGYFVLRSEWERVADIFGQMLRVQDTVAKGDRRKAEEAATKMFREIPEHAASGTRYLCLDCDPIKGFVVADHVQPKCPFVPAHTKLLQLKKSGSSVKNDS